MYLRLQNLTYCSRKVCDQCHLYHIFLSAPCTRSVILHNRLHDYRPGSDDLHDYEQGSTWVIGGWLLDGSVSFAKVRVAFSIILLEVTPHTSDQVSQVSLSH